MSTTAEKIAGSIPVEMRSFGSVTFSDYPMDCGWHGHATLRGYIRDAKKHPDGRVVILLRRRENDRLIPGNGTMRDAQGTVTENPPRIVIACSDLIAAIESGADHVACEFWSAS